MFDKSYESILKNIFKIVDYQIQLELIEHLNKYISKPEDAFSPEGIEDFNSCRLIQNKPSIFNIKFCESGSKRFSLGNKIGNRHKQMEATDGTNLFFAIYWDEEKQKRNYETIPLNEVIAHQKQVASLPKNQRTPIQPNPSKGNLLFTLSPNDIVYVPTDEETENPNLVDFRNLTKEQSQRIYKMVSCTGSECHFLLSTISSLIKNYDAKSKIGEMGSLNKQETDIDNNIRIKERCWKLRCDRLGNLSKV